MLTNVCDKCGVRFQDVTGKIPKVIEMVDEFTIKPVDKKYSAICKAIRVKYRAFIGGF
jgi:hypothetical protein